MGILGRAVFREVFTSAALGTILFTFVLFLQKLGKIFEILVRSSASAKTALYLFALVLPPILTFAVPLGVLVGVLIGLSRMSSDGEVTAMRSAGVPGRRVVYPVAVFALLAVTLTSATSLWLTPWSIRESYRALNKLLAEEMTAEIQPRVFEEQFPNAVLYVGDVLPGKQSVWRDVFIADVTPPDRRKPGAPERGDSPMITLSARAIATPDIGNNRIQLAMQGASTHRVAGNGEYHTEVVPRRLQALDARRPGEIRPVRVYPEMDTVPLKRLAYARGKAAPPDAREARIELHQRLSLPPACLLLALVGVPLGVSTRKAGRSAAFVMTVVLALLYYTSLMGLIGVARSGKLPVELAVWLPDTVLALIGLFLMYRLEKPGDRDLIGQASAFFLRLSKRFRVGLPESPGAMRLAALGRMPLLPQIVDLYILSSFLFYFGVLLATFVSMTHVFTFFELAGDIIRNHVAMPRVLSYLFYLTPKLIYDSTPISVLVAVLVTFGVLTKNNEVTAMKACGVSLYRMAIPVYLASLALSVGLFAFDHYYVPEANRKQDAIRAEIKGRRVQTYLNPNRQWIVFNNGSRIYYYKYFDPNESVMGGVNVYELDLKRFRLVRHVSAERARWAPTLKAWVFENGWARNVDGMHVAMQPFPGQTATFSELSEPPSNFLKEVKQDKQMNFEELAAYIEDLRASGFDTVRLQVQFYKKFSVPLFALIMAMISIPFAFLTGNRGAMAGVGVSFGIAIAYWSVSQLFEQVGNLNQLPPAVAAWSPDALFALAGLYLLARVRT
jgi:LPS export ABC transporter permease LptG/LPS export ABC transporter permease LptF